MNLQRYFTATNALMRDTLRQLDRKRQADITGPLKPYSEVILSAFTERDGSLFLSSYLDRKGQVTFTSSGSVPNRSCWEQSINRLELGHGIPAKYRGPEIIVHGIAVAEIIRLKLSDAKTGRRFIIRVSWNARPMFETRRQYEATRKCVVSFWTLRTDEAVFAPLEEFEYEAIGELTVA